jgi:ABC-2 type transport system permease protein
MIRSSRAYWLDTHFTALELLRLPAYSVPSLALPTMLYLFFGLSFSRNAELARYALGSYAVFAVIGVALFQFGVGIAHDRVSAWESYMRTIPISGVTRLFARLTSALLFAGAAATLVITCGVLLAHVSLSPVAWLRFIAALLIGGSVFAAAGMAIGYWTSPKTSVPITNLTYLPLAFIGGLWLPPQFLPSVVAAISPWTPTRQFGELVWSSVSGESWPLRALATLAVYAMVFTAIAVFGYRRNESQRYG